MSKKTVLLFSVLTMFGFVFATWSNWMDRDNPSGVGDYELFTGPCVGLSGVVHNVEVNLVGGTGTSFFFTGNKYDGTLFGKYAHIYGPFWTGTAEKGMYCANVENSGGCAQDYKVRFDCY